MANPNPKPVPKQHLWKKGQSGNPAGGKKGVLRRFMDQKTAEDRIKLADEAGMTPLQFLLSVMVDQEHRMDDRIDAAKTAAPYYHRKMPIAVETNTPGQTLDIAALAKLPKGERETFLRIMAKMGIAV